MSQLTGAQKASLIDALLSGYTSDEELAELLDLHLDVKLAEIAEDGTLRQQVFAVVTWFEAHGRTKDLALQAQKYRPRNEALAAFADAHYPGERTQRPSQSKPSESKPSDSKPFDFKPFGSGSSESAPSASRPRGAGSFESRSRFPMLAYGAVAVAVLIAVLLITLRPWRGPDDGGNGTSGNGGKGGENTKDRPRLPATLRFTDLTGTQSSERVFVVDARFAPQQLAPGSVLWFVVGAGQRCRERLHRAQVDNPALGYMTSIIKAERARPTCAQLFVEDANGQAIARSDPRDITFPSR
jgi:hypothetical protein